MPRLPTPVNNFLSAVQKSLESVDHLDLSAEDLQAKFASDVATLPDCQLKKDILRHSEACVSQLQQSLEGKFCLTSIPQGLIWNLAAPGGIKRALSGLESNHLSKYCALLCSSYCKQHTSVILSDFLMKAVPESLGDGNVIAKALDSFGQLSKSCSAHNTISALWRFLNGHISTVSSISSHTLEPVACSLESSLRGIHTKHSAESTETVSMPGEPEYADLMAACLSWLTDVWVSLCNDGHNRHASFMSCAAELLSGHTQHLLDMVLQVSIAPTSTDSFDLLLPLVLFSCQQCSSLETPPVCIKFLACCRIGRKLSESSPSQTSLAADFRRIGLSATPPPELKQWIQESCDESLLESLAVHEKWSSHQICLHLMLYANEDAVDELLDVASGINEDRNNMSAIVENEHAPSLLSDEAADNLFMVDVAGHGFSMSSQSEPSADDYSEDSEDDRRQTPLVISSDEDEGGVDEGEDEDDGEDECGVDEPMDTSPSSVLVMDTSPSSVLVTACTEDTEVALCLTPEKAVSPKKKVTPRRTGTPQVEESPLRRSLRTRSSGIKAS